MSATGQQQADRILTVTRVFDAPRDAVFKAWTDETQLPQWCAPRGFTISKSEGKIRPGGRWRTCMRSPDGVEYRVGGAYREIIPGQRIVFTHVWEEDDGQPEHETVVTVTFADEGKTIMTFHQEIFKSRESRDSHREGWEECFDRLDAYLKA